MNILKDNHGWGIQEMILMCLVLFVGLAVSVIIIQKSFQNLNTNNKNYLELEEKMVSAAGEYVNKYEQDNVYINLDKLIDTGLIAVIKDNNNKSCKGYVNLKEHKAYLKCSDYETVNYDENILK